MRSTSKPERTFTSQARRAQIVAAAIEVIAEEGYAQASIRKIAQRVGVAMSVVLYHFSDKDELVEAIVLDLYRSVIAMMTPALASEESAGGRLAAYIRTNAAFVKDFRSEHVALLDIGNNYRSADGKRLWEIDIDPSVLAGFAQLDLAAILAAGQTEGVFRPFYVGSMAMAIRGALNSTVMEVATNPDFDVLEYAERLVEIFDVATRRGPEGRTANGAPS